MHTIKETLELEPSQILAYYINTKEEDGAFNCITGCLTTNIIKRQHAKAHTVYSTQIDGG